MLELLEYNDLGKLNQKLQALGKNPRVKIRKVKLTTVGEQVRFYLLIEYGTESYQTDNAE